MKGGYQANSITLLGAVSMGTGVMIGAGIFALTGQVAELAGPFFPLAFLAAAGVTGCSAYSYIKMSNAYPSAGGIVVFALAALWAAGISFEAARADRAATSPEGFVAAVALAILAYKGFTTITNSGGEIEEPHRNVGRAIIIAIAICVVIYILVALAVGANLSIDEIVRARDYALAEAARPAFGTFGLWFTVLFAIIATVSGVIASVFAVSRMLAMVTEMKLVPHSHFGMPGDIQKHSLVYTVVAAMLLTVFFDLGRIASLGAIFYIVMDIAVQWGVLRHLRREIGANAAIIVTAIILDALVLAALIAVKASTDVTVIYVAIAGMALVFLGERFFLRTR